MIRELCKEELDNTFFDLNYEGFLYHYNHRKDIFKMKKYEEIRDFTLEKVDNGLKVLGFFKEDKLIGFLSYEINDKSKATKYLWIDEFEISENERGKGYGTLLLKEVKEIAKKENIKRIELNVFDFNKNAINLYRKLGYTEQRYTLEMFLGE